MRFRARASEFDALSAALEATARRLEDLVARERTFSADASHQMRTPVAALRLELEALELRGGGSPEITAALAQVDRLQSTVDTLLSVTRDSPRGETRADLQDLLVEAESRWRGLLAAEGRPLRLESVAPRPVAAADSGVVSEVLEVLLSNAH